MRVSKGLEFPVAALAGVGYMPAKAEDEYEAAWAFYVSARRVTKTLLVGGFGVMLGK